MGFATGTSVSEEKSRQEIERMLAKYGASRFGVLTDYEHRKATIGFTIKSIQVEMVIPLPDPKDKKFKYTHNGSRYASEPKQAEQFQQEVRRRWRSLCLSLKAKLVSVEDGITTFEREFLPYMVTASGQTIGERLEPVIRAVMQSGGVIPSTLALPAGRDE